MNVAEYRENVLKVMREFEKGFNPVDEFLVTDALAELYEMIRAIPTESAEMHKG